MSQFNGFPDKTTNTRHVARFLQGKLTKPQLGDLLGRDDPYIQRVVPRMNHAVGFVPWPALNMVGIDLTADLMVQGCKAPMAAKIAARMMDAHLSAPTVAQWVVIVTENGNVSVLDFKTVDLGTGFISGSRLAFALIIDLRLYAERVERAFANINSGAEEARADA